MKTTTEDRVRMLENRYRKIEIDIGMAHLFQIALLRRLGSRFPGFADGVIEEVQKLADEARAEALMDDALAADSLVNQLQQDFSLPAND